MPQPLMPKATAVWLLDNTVLTFQQIAEFCNLHLLEVKGIADGDVARGIRGADPIAAGQLTRAEIESCQEDPEKRLTGIEKRENLPKAERRVGKKYTPLSKRQDRPDAIFWLVRNHPELLDAQISRLIGTTKNTIQSIRDRTHWNSAYLNPVDPVSIGLCTQIDLQSERTSKKQLIAKIISDSASPTKNIVAIDKGKNDGAFVGQNVIGIKGLIGQVIETTFVSSKVILINDTSHNVPGEINRTGEKVIVSGTKDKNKLEIDFLDVNTDIRVGDIVSTSGLGERFKAKIPIGKVTFVEQDPEREFSEIEIKSFENLENLTDLILIWDYKPNMNTNKKSDNNENNGSKDNE